jgi:hypothetical protein
MSNLGRGLTAIASAAVALAVLAWLDATVLAGAQRSSAASFNSSGLGLLFALTAVAVAGGILLLGVVGWWSSSGWIGVTYAIAGAFFAFLPVLIFNPSLPDPLSQRISEIYLATAGPLNAVLTYGAGMFLVGLLMIGRSSRGRSRPALARIPDIAGV